MSAPDLLPHRLNFDAIVFCGCTMREMYLIAMVSLSVCMIFCGLLTKFLFNMILIGVGLSFPLGVGLSWLVALWFQRAKQGKPIGFVKERLWFWCETQKLCSVIFVRRTGKWSVGRKV